MSSFVKGEPSAFFNSEAFGLPCDYPWGMFVSPQFRPIEYKNFEYFHPTFLYESISNILVLVIMYIILRKQGEERKPTSEMTSTSL